MSVSKRSFAKVIGTPIDVIDWDEVIFRIWSWGKLHESRMVCICNVHSVVVATQDFAYAKTLRDSDMNTPDGAPVAWMLRKLGASNQQRINGPDLMWKYCEYASKNGGSIFLYGSTETTLTSLNQTLSKFFPTLPIAGSYSPPFRPLTQSEDEEIVKRINESGANLVWVSLGCPKQETWMSAHRGRINAVMVGVGAAFDYHAGTIKRAPLWMQNSGLEWLHRLCSEPNRLWKRYLVTNSLFIYFAIRQLVFCRSKS